MSSPSRIDIVALGISVVSVLVAAFAVYESHQSTNEQAEAAAPVLAPGTPQAERGKQIPVATEYGKPVSKRADRMFLERAPRGRVIIPLRNGGSGIALTIGVPVVVADCVSEPKLLPEAAVKPPLGTYVLPSGSSDQLAYRQKALAGGTVPGDEKLWYSFDYAHFGAIKKRFEKYANLVIWYTDGAQRRLRSTCIQYQRSGRHGLEWAVEEQDYDTRPMVSLPQLRTR